ncbi:hypothetical protein MSAN_01734400 [Mycena sanguinolenta]|uniref:Uncharacterized protein n=1 Tax=Mycena sanguinolenta TaxID=230812 RepID=A0A8H6XZY9_9AGAR|nr:hypothetical protein MSAN_01734400 [Mycena sanguinolenta]
MYVTFAGVYVLLKLGTGYSWLRLEVALECLFHGLSKLRIYALYDSSPRIAAFVVGAFLLQVLAVIGLFGLGSADNTAFADCSVVAEAVGNLVRCNVTSVPKWLWVFWVPVTSFEFLLCVLVIYKGYRRIGSNDLQDILVRDSVMYYLAIQCVYLFNLISWVKDAKASLEVLTALAVALPAIFSGRMMINVRRALAPTDVLGSPSQISLGEISLPTL